MGSLTDLEQVLAALTALLIAAAGFAKLVLPHLKRLEGGGSANQNEARKLRDELRQAKEAAETRAEQSERETETYKGAYYALRNTSSDIISHARYVVRSTLTLLKRTHNDAATEQLEQLNDHLTTYKLPDPPE